MTTETDATHWAYSASGTYARPFDGGTTLHGTWQASGGSDASYAVQSPSTLNPDGSWTTTGTASSSGSGWGSWSYSGSAAASSSSSYGNSASGGDSSSSVQVAETYAQGWSSQYVVLSTLAANGSVATVTTGSASGGASGEHSYTSSGASSSWSQTGDYAAGNGTSSESAASSGQSVTEALQSQWQEGYTIASLPGQATTTTGGASGSSHLSGDASSWNDSSGSSESDSSYGSGYSYASGQGDTNTYDTQDHYDDQSGWSEPYNLLGTSGSGATTTDRVWGDAASGGSYATWWDSQSSGGGGGSGASSYGWLSSGGYDQQVWYTGFQGAQYYYGYGAAPYDGGWRWGQGGYGVGRNGPLGPTAFSGVGYAFTPGAPVSVAAVADQSGMEGNRVALQVQATDWGAASGSGSGMGGGSGMGSGAVVGYSAWGLPGGLAIDPNTGLISGTLQAGDAASGPYVVTVAYADAAGNSAGRTFLWTVTDPVTVQVPADQSGVEGGAVSLPMAAADANGAALTWTAAGLPAGLAIDPASGVISGVPTAGDAAAGPYVVTVTAADSGGSGDNQTFLWNVADAVTIKDPGAQSATEGAPVALQLQAADANGAALTWSATGLPPGLAIDPNTGLITGTMPAGIAASGPYVATVTAADAGGSSASQSVVWDVASPVTVTDPGDQSVTEGGPALLQIQAADSNPSGGALSYSATGLPTGLGIDPNTGLISGTVARSAAGPFTATVTATDAAGYSGSQSIFWDVSGPVTVADPGPQSAAENAPVSLQMSASDVDFDSGALTWAATGLPAGLSIDPNSGLVTGTVAAGAYAAGPYAATVTATDSNGYAGAQTVFWDIVDPVTVTNPGDQSGTEGVAVALQMQAADAWGGALTWTATGLPTGLAINAGTGVISGAPAAGDAAAGPYQVTVTATDPGGTSASQTFQWDVAQAVAVTNPADQSGTEGDVVYLVVSATDVGGAPAYGAKGLPPGLAIDPNTGVISGAIAAGAAAGGPYEVTVTATDGPYSDSQTFLWSVAAPASAAGPSADFLPGGADALDAIFASLGRTGRNGFDDGLAGQGPIVLDDMVYWAGQNNNVVALAAAAPAAGNGAAALDFNAIFPDPTERQEVEAWWDNLPANQRQPLLAQLQAVQPRTVNPGSDHLHVESVAQQQAIILRIARGADQLPVQAAPPRDPIGPAPQPPAAPPAPVPVVPDAAPGSGLGLMSKEEYDTWMFILDNAFLEANARANLLTAAGYALNDLPAAVQAKVAEFLTPDAIKAYITTFIVVAEAQAAGPEVAATVDTVLAGVAYAWLGNETLSVVCDIGRYLFNAVYAESDADLQQAGAYLAHALATIVGDAGFVVATAAASKLAKTYKLSMTYKLAIDPETAAVPKTPAELNAKVAELKADMANEGHTSGKEVLLDPALGQTRCFAAGTPLRTPEGDKPVERFREGDLILARSEHDAAGPVEARRVERVFVRVSPLLELRVGDRSIRTTAEHPFHVAGRGWVGAAFLRPGDALVTEDGGPVLIERVVETREVATVYNVQVEEHHTYFVGAREWGFAVWAHNADYTVGTNALGQPTVEFKGKVTDWEAPAELGPDAAKDAAQAEANRLNEAAEAARQKKAAEAAKEARLKETAEELEARRGAARQAEAAKLKALSDQELDAKIRVVSLEHCQDDVTMYRTSGCHISAEKSALTQAAEKPGILKFGNIPGTPPKSGTLRKATTRILTQTR